MEAKSLQELARQLEKNVAKSDLPETTVETGRLPTEKVKVVEAVAEQIKAVIEKPAEVPALEAVRGKEKATFTTETTGEQILRSAAQGLDVTPRTFAFFARQYANQPENELYLSMARHEGAFVEWEGKPYVVEDVNIEARTIELYDGERYVTASIGEIQNVFTTEEQIKNNLERVKEQPRLYELAYEVYSGVVNDEIAMTAEQDKINIVQFAQIKNDLRKMKQDMIAFNVITEKDEINFDKAEEARPYAEASFAELEASAKFKGITEEANFYSELNRVTRDVRAAQKTGKEELIQASLGELKSMVDAEMRKPEPDLTKLRNVLTSAKLSRDEATIKYVEEAVDAQRAKSEISILDEIGSDIDDVIRIEAEDMITSMTETNEERVDKLKAELVLCG